MLYIYSVYVIPSFADSGVLSSYGRSNKFLTSSSWFWRCDGVPSFVFPSVTVFSHHMVSAAMSPHPLRIVSTLISSTCLCNDVRYIISAASAVLHTNTHQNRRWLRLSPADAGLNRLSQLTRCYSDVAAAMPAITFASTSSSNYLSLHIVCVIWIHISCFVREGLFAYFLTHKGCVCMCTFRAVYGQVCEHTSCHADVNVEFKSAQLSSGYSTFAERFIVQENWLCAECLRETYNCDEQSVCCIGIRKVFTDRVWHRVIAARFTSILLFTVSSACWS